jgi:hypothetical protein
LQFGKNLQRLPFEYCRYTYVYVYNIYI